jgi:chemosensory pili system protein ChpA (sensor histidine kinase/response regulator)
MQHQLSDGERASNLESDLGPLAWVLDELRKSLDGATKALRRFVRDAELARGSDLAALDASQLRIARQQLHQAVGALEMVGLEVPAKMLRAMEALVQKFVQRPEFCSDEAAQQGGARQLCPDGIPGGYAQGPDGSPVALFPQYREVLDLVGGDRVHPADLWPGTSGAGSRCHTVPQCAALAYDRRCARGSTRRCSRWSRRATCRVSPRDDRHQPGFCGARPSLEPRVFWAVAAGLFRGRGWACARPMSMPNARPRASSAAVHATLARANPTWSERLAQDLLVLIVRRRPCATPGAPALQACSTPMVL